MYRILPSIFTVGNLFCGFLAISYILDGRYVPATWLIVLGGALDTMDGRIARFIGNDSKFGIEFDSLADVCTFGIAPALMVYRESLNSGWGVAIAFAFLLCGALRLARYNLLSHEDERGELFLGLPIPAAAVALSQYVVFTKDAWQPSHDGSVAVVFVLLLSGLMVSRVEYDSMPNFRATTLWGRLKQGYFVSAVALILHPSTSKGFFFPLVVVYLLTGIYRWVAGIFRDEVTQHA